MPQILHAFAPAKINLFLHILGRNPNGYHRLQTIFQLLSFGDQLEFELLPSSTIELIAPECDFPVENNLVYRAATQLQAMSPDKPGVKITLHKHIPTGAGLGGGSSDAGTTLNALNSLWNLNLPKETLMPLACKLGADVPVFVLQKNAWAEGIGDQLTPIALAKQYYLIVNPCCPVATAPIYQHLELPRNTAPISMQDYHYETTHNDFEVLVCKLYPEIAKALTWLKQFGNARLTGSGGCLFLPVTSEAKAKEINALVPAPWHGIVCWGN